MNISAVALLSIMACASAFAPSFGVPKSTSGTQLDARKPFISGNWKLNPQTKDEAVTLANEIADKISDSSPDADVALFVPYVFIEAAMTATGGKLMVGAEVSFLFHDKNVLFVGNEYHRTHQLSSWKEPPIILI